MTVTFPLVFPSQVQTVGHGDYVGDSEHAWNSLQALAGTRVDDIQWAGGADPTGLDDSSAAFLAAMAGAGGGTTYVPPGTYKLSNPLLVASSMAGGSLVGAGIASRLMFDGGVVPTLIAMADSTQRTYNVRDLRITQTSGSSVGTAVDMSHFVYSESERLLIDGSTNKPNQGIIINSSDAFYNWVKNCRVNVDGANAIGVRFDSGANNNRVFGGRVFLSGSDNSQIGYVVNAKSCALYSPNCQGGAGVGVDAQSGGVACSIYDPYFENNATANYRLASGLVAFSSIGGTVENDSAYSPNIVDNGAIAPFIINARTSHGGDQADTRGILSSEPQPDDFGFISWNYDPATASTGIAATLGTIYLAQVQIRQARLVSKLATFLTAGNGTPTANQNFMALVNAGGVIQCATAAGAMDTPCASSGWCSVSVATPTVVPPGAYWVATLMNGSGTVPSFARGTTTPGGANVGLAASKYRWATNGSGTALPGSFTPGSNSQTGVITMPVAVS